MVANPPPVPALGTLELSVRDQNILAHMYAFGMTTNEVLHRRFFRGKTIDAAKAWVYRMRRRGYVDSLTLYGRTKCHHLTAQALRRLYGESTDGDPNGVIERQIAARYAALWFCCIDDPFREPINGVAPLPDADGECFYRETQAEHGDAPSRLGYLIVDAAWSVARIVARYEAIVEHCRDDASWRATVQRHRGIAIVILTTWAGKARTIHEVLGPPDDREIPYRTVVVPRLLDLV